MFMNCFIVSGAVQEQAFPLLLESNCYAAIGALAGLQKSAGPLSPRVGMIWIDAHGDCNTPDTTLSGMLSGMPVAIASGLCLNRLRKQAGVVTFLDSTPHSTGRSQPACLTISGLEARRRAKSAQKSLLLGPL